ncbi:anti-sigma factor domain-containing protein [Aquibacillus albus]|uniref:Chemotaxis protein histidine kinase CheA n=1 Tax=Aquibacillus albus TaxID=1168171 RepID=A0ABS2N0N4_9BACI|nr:hypothetical protein [Aquibacillus albus]MBM7571613.1 chemotaxis protein histidine kinase CheA [Aquibacillus albus]
MKKGIVVEQHRRYTIIMDNNGQFHKAEPVHDAAIGSETTFYPKQISRLQTLLFSDAPVLFKAVATVIVLLIVSFPLYQLFERDEVYAFVDISINPSVEIALNEKMEVEEIQPLNQDAKALLEEIEDLRGQSIQTAADDLISKSQELNLISELNAVLIGIHYTDQPNEESLITEILDDYFIQNPKKELKIATFEIPNDVREKAEAQKISMNELLASSLNEESSLQDDSSKLNEEEKELIQSYFNKENKLEEPTPTQDEENDVAEEQIDQEKEEEVEEKIDEKVEDKVEENEKVPESNVEDNQPSTDEKNEEPRESKEEEEELTPEIREKLENLPPGIKKKLEELSIDIEELEDLPPGLQKRLENIPFDLEEELGEVIPGLER